MAGNDSTDYPIIKATVTLEERPKFYAGKLPLVYHSVMKSLMDVSLTMGHYIIELDFGEFKTTFSYTDGMEQAGIASKAKTIGRSGQLLAEAHKTTHRTGSMGLAAVEIEEVHFDNRGAVSFECTSEINADGYKQIERVKSGAKRHDYYFMWPVDLYPKDDIGLEDSPISPSARDDFFHTTVFEVIEPQRLPSVYSWLRPGIFGLYRGEIRYPAGKTTRADWAWEIVRVNGEMSDGRPSALAYSIFLSTNSQWFGKAANLPMPPMELHGTLRAEKGLDPFTRGLPDPGRQMMPQALSFPVLFPFAALPPRANTRIKTPFGDLPCFSLERPGLGYVRGTAYYLSAAGMANAEAMLVGMDIGDDGKRLCSFRLEEANITL
jgi:hypothetical protein